jgi:hypothetical protein
VRAPPAGRSVISANVPAALQHHLVRGKCDKLLARHGSSLPNPATHLKSYPIVRRESRADSLLAQTAGIVNTAIGTIRSMDSDHDTPVVLSFDFGSRMPD